MILVILATLAVMTVSATGLLGQTMLSGRVKGASEELAIAIRSARELAVAEARDHCISMSAGSPTITSLALRFLSTGEDRVRSG